MKHGRRNRYGHHGHARTSFSANPMAYYCVRAENYCRACQLEYDVDCASENDSGMAAARIVIVHSCVYTRRKRCGFHVSAYKNMRMEHSCASAACSFNTVRSLVIEVIMERYFRHVARSGSQPPPSGGESSECSYSQTTQMTVSTSTNDASMYFPRELCNCCLSS